MFHLEHARGSRNQEAIIADAIGHHTNRLAAHLLAKAQFRASENPTPLRTSLELRTEAADLDEEAIILRRLLKRVSTRPAIEVR